MSTVELIAQQWHRGLCLDANRRSNRYWDLDERDDEAAYLHLQEPCDAQGTCNLHLSSYFRRLCWEHGWDSDLTPVVKLP